MSDCGRYVPSDLVVEGRRANQEDLPASQQDIEFPYGAACDAIAVCQRIADTLELHLEGRDDLVAPATAEWTGGHADEFDGEWSSLETRVGLIKDGLRNLAGDIEDAWDEADSINETRAENRP